MELKIYPDSVLKKKSRVVKQVTDEIVARAQEMLEFMYEADGLGLAAPQVGWSERIVTLDVELEKKDPRVFVNPTITAREGHQEEDEGCLSLPGLRV
ncbi:MAG: peptide deformylase, partial [Planctomycetota bacterium]